MVKQKLKPKILEKFKKKFPDKTENAIQVKLSKLSRKHKVTLNAAAEIWAKEEGFSVWGSLEDEDRKSLENKTFQLIKLKNNSNNIYKKKIIQFIYYNTDNSFLKGHVDEINKCYTSNCYTASFILLRKVIENLITEIIKKKFLGKNKEDKELYLNFDTGHIRDLSEIIKNLRDKSNTFAPDEKKLIQRILQLSEQFKDDANDKTHSLYHLCNKKELDDKNPQEIFNLIKEFFDKY